MVGFANDLRHIDGLQGGNTLSDTERGIIRDVDTLMDWFGVDLQTWNRMTLDEQRGIKLFDLVQGDAGAIAELLPRISTPTLTKAEALSLKMRDLTAAMNIIGLMLTDEETMGKDSP